MYKRCFLLLVAVMGLALPCRALSGWEHATDMYRIFPFDSVPQNKAVLRYYRLVNSYLDYPYTQPGERPSKNNPKRPKCIADHPKFSKIHWQGKHRIWFHWGFNTDPRQFAPITNSLNAAIADGVIQASDLPEFWDLMNAEVSKRNRALMNEGAAVFGFGELGAISAAQRRQLNGLVTVLYSIHILGDHQTTDSNDIVPLNRVYADVYSAIDNIAGKDAANYAKAKTLKQQLKPYQQNPKSFLDAMERFFSPFLLSLSGPGYDYKVRWKDYSLRK